MKPSQPLRKIIAALCATAVLSLPFYTPGAWAKKSEKTPAAFGGRLGMPLPQDNAQAQLFAHYYCSWAVETAGQQGYTPEQAGIIMTVYEKHAAIPAFAESVVSSCRGMGLEVRKIKVKSSWKAFVKTIEKKMPFELGIPNPDDKENPEFVEMVNYFHNKAMSLAETEEAYQAIGQLPRSFFRRVLKNTYISFKRFFGVENGVSFSMYFDDKTGIKRPWKDEPIFDSHGKKVDTLHGARTEFRLKWHLIMTSFIITALHVVSHHSGMNVGFDQGELMETPGSFFQAFGGLDLEGKLRSVFSPIVMALFYCWFTFTGQANHDFLVLGKRYVPRLNKVIDVPTWSVNAQVAISSVCRLVVPMIAFGTGILSSFGWWLKYVANNYLSAIGKVPLVTAISRLKKSRDPKRKASTQDGKAKSDLWVMAADSILQTSFTVLTFTHLLSEGNSRLKMLYYALGLGGLGFLTLKYLKGNVEAPLWTKKAWQAIGRGVKDVFARATGRRKIGNECQVRLQLLPLQNFSNRTDTELRKESISKKIL